MSREPDVKRSVRETARAMRNHSKRSAKFHQRDRNAQYATVLKAGALELELHGGGLLDENDITLGQWARAYDSAVGIEPGDTVVVQHMGDRYWLVAEVVSDADADISGGSAPTGPAGGVLSGTYPNPGFAVDMATQAELDAVAGAAVNDGDTAGGALDGTYPNPGLAASVAGGGLTETTNVLAVGEGYGIDVAADAVAVDPTEINLNEWAAPDGPLNLGPYQYANNVWDGYSEAAVGTNTKPSMVPIHVNSPGPNSPVKWSRIARISLSGTYESAHIHGFIKTGGHVGLETVCEIDFTAFTMADADVPTISYRLVRGERKDGSDVPIRVYRNDSGGDPGYDLYVEDGWFSYSWGQLEIKQDTSDGNTYTIWQDGETSITSPSGTLQTPNLWTAVEGAGLVFGTGTAAPDLTIFREAAITGNWGVPHLHQGLTRFDGLASFDESDHGVWLMDDWHPNACHTLAFYFDKTDDPSGDATYALLTMGWTGDTNPRFGIFNSGKLWWGGGAAVEDTNLYRSAANTLRTDDAFQAATRIDAGFGQAAGNNAVGVFASGDSVYRMVVTNDGALHWGSGSGAVDTHLSRVGAGYLLLDGGLFTQGVDYNTGLKLKSTTTVSTRSTNLQFEDNQASPVSFYMRKEGNALQMLNSGGNTIDFELATGKITLLTDTNLYREGAAALATSGSGGASLGLVNSADSSNGLTLQGGGGGLAGIVNVRRNEGLFVVQTGGTRRLAVDQNDRLTFGSAGDTDLFRYAADVLATSDSFWAQGSYLQSNNSTYLGGTTFFGPAGGAGPWDTNLYRSAANRLKTDDEFYAAGIIYTDLALYSYLNTANQVALGRKDGITAAPGVVFGNDHDTNLYRSAANELTTDDSLVALGRRFTTSNLDAEYSWFWGNGTDLAWKKIADISLPNSAYSAIAFIVTVTDSLGNFGGNAQQEVLSYRVAARRSAGVPDDLNDGIVSGPVEDYVRLVKTATGIYELQVRQPDTYRSMQVHVQATSSDIGGPPPFPFVTYVDSPADGSTSGTIYTATLADADHYDRLTNLAVRGVINIGADTNLYRSAANQLKTDDKFFAAGLDAGDQKITNVANGTLADDAVAFGQLSGFLTNPLPADTWLASVGADDRLFFATNSHTYIKAPDTAAQIIFRVGSDTNGYLFDAASLTVQNTSNLIYFGSAQDTNLYRNAANQLKTDDDFIVGDDLTVTNNHFTGLAVYSYLNTANQVTLGRKDGITASPGIVFGLDNDTNLYRSAADTLKTDDKFIAAGGLDAGDQKITNVANGTAADDAAAFGQLAGYQPLHDILTDLAGLTQAADKGIYFNSATTAATFDLTAAGRALLDDANSAAMRATLDVEYGIDVQAWSAILDDLAGLTQAANKGFYFDSATTAATFDLTAAGRALLDDADAAAQRVTLDVPSNAEAVLDTIFNGKGELITASAPDTPAIRTVGSNGQVLTADSAQSTGLQWNPLSTITGGIAVGMICSYGGFEVPTGYLECDGTEVSRSTYSDLFGVLCKSTTADRNSTITLTNIPSTTGFEIGMPVQGDGIPERTVIASVVSSSSITLSKAATSTGTGGALVVLPWNQYSDTSTTNFRLPQLAGRAPFGRGTPQDIVIDIDAADVNTTANTFGVPTTHMEHIYTGTPIGFVSSTVTIPGGLTALTQYYAIRASATTFQVASSLANAVAGTPVDITSQGSGVHKFVPNAPGNSRLGLVGGEREHALTTTELASHSHTTGTLIGTGGANNWVGTNGSFSTNTGTNAAGGSNAHNNLGPYVGTRFIIKT